MNSYSLKKLILIVEPSYDIIKSFSDELNATDEIIAIIRNKSLYLSLNKIDRVIPIQFNINSSNMELLYKKLNNLQIIPNIVMSFTELYAPQVIKIASHYNAFLPQNKLLQLRDKSYMKRQFKKYNIPHADGAEYASYEKYLKINTNPTFPSIIKPTHGYSSVGVTKVSSLSELKIQFRKVELLNKLSLIENHSSIIVEDYIDGKEYAVDSLWTNGKRIVTFVHQNKSGKGPNFLDHLYFIDPVDNQKVQTILENAEEKVTLATGVIFGFTHTEYRIHNGVPYVIETSNRPAGAGMLFSTIQRSTGYNMINLFYNYVLNTSKKSENIFPLKVTYNVNSINFWVSPLFKNQGVFQSFNGLEQIKKLPYIYSVKTYISNGDYYYSDNSQVMYPLVIKGEININKKLDNIVKEIEEKITMNIQ